MTERIAEGEPLTAVVVAGAVARGSYEAAALRNLLPRFAPDLRKVVFVGTSAGAINAALWAGFAAQGTSPEAAGQAVQDVWANIEDKHVFAPLARTSARNLVRGSIGFLNGRGLSSLLDARPLRETVRQRLDKRAIARNISRGAIAGVAVVATACGSTIAGARSHVFVQGGSSLQMPRQSTDSSIDYYAEALHEDHVLASSAVPVLFQPIKIEAARIAARPSQFYVDGGVRLNTPIKPAIALGAKRIIIVSSHSATYAPNSPSPEALGTDDSLALILHSVLADGMVEDLRRLREINRLVREADQKAKGLQLHSKTGRTLEEIEFIVVAPKPGQLAGLARQALTKARPSLHAGRYHLLDALFRFAGSGSGRDELLSYLFFDRGYSKSQFELGQEHAAQITQWST